MEMKTNSVEVLIRQMPKSQKTDEKSVNDSYGFKKMMREKDLKKDTGSKGPLQKEHTADRHHEKHTAFHNDDKGCI